MRLSRKRLSLIILSGITLSILIVFLFSSGDLSAALAFFTGPFSTAWGFGTMLGQASLILMCALGASIALRAGTVNLGGEGQVYAGGLAAFMTMHLLRDLPLIVSLSAGFVAALAMGAAMGSVSGLMRKVADSDELISSFLVSQAVIPLADFLISSVVRDPASQIIATFRLPERLLAPSLPGMGGLSTVAILALLAMPLSHAFLHKSLSGHETLLSGHSPRFARAMGIRVDRRRGMAFILGAALTALAGYMAVQGGSGRVIRSFSAGIGWNGLACAIIARGKPLFCLPSALLFSYLSSAALSGQMRAGMRPELSSLIQALILFLAATPLLPLVRRDRP